MSSIFSDLGAERIAQIVTELVSASDGDNAGLGDFRLERDEHGRVVGDFYQARLSSVFQPLWGEEGRRIVGHAARIRCDDGLNHTTISPWSVFAMIASDAALVRLDRLCRALHLLNYFGQAEPDWKLWLRVEKRLLSSVKHDHGKVFGRVLEHYVGIPTSRVVIELPVEAASEPALLTSALQNYRSRGYQTAINHSDALDDALLQVAAPDVVRVDVKTVSAEKLPAVVKQVHQAGAIAAAKRIETARERDIAVDAGADLLQGFFFGQPTFDAASASPKRVRLRAAASDPGVGITG